MRSETFRDNDLLFPVPVAYADSTAREEGWKEGRGRKGRSHFVPHRTFDTSANPGGGGSLFLHRTPTTKEKGVRDEEMGFERGTPTYFVFDGSSDA